MKFVGMYSAMMWPCVLCCYHYSFSVLRQQVGCGRAGFRFGEWKLGDWLQVCCGIGWSKESNPAWKSKFFSIIGSSCV